MPMGDDDRIEALAGEGPDFNAIAGDVAGVAPLVAIAGTGGGSSQPRFHDRRNRSGGPG